MSSPALMRGDYKQSDYGKVILPFTVLRRLDFVLEPTKAAVSSFLFLRLLCALDVFNCFVSSPNLECVTLWN